MLQPLTKLTFSKVKFKWKDIEQKVFNNINQIVEYNNLSAYRDFNKKNDIHTEASNIQLVSVISQ